MIDRISKLTLVVAIACFFSVVVFNNITDYGSNFAYVQHVLSMDTIFPASTLTWRAITNPPIHHFVFCSIIAWEAITTGLCWIGAFRLTQALRADAATFNAAKSPVLVGLAASCWLWLFGFLCVGGEWFAMWQSPTWNGQPIAFRMFVITSVVLFLVRQPDGEWRAGEQGGRGEGEQGEGMMG